MADNEKQNQSSADINLHAGAKVTLRRSLTRKQNGDRNYKTLYSGRYILNRNINGIKQIIDRNFKKIW